MIVYNLACDREHPFEGWFASPAAFENQRDRGLVECPVCGSNEIERKLHAPRINMGAQQSAAGMARDAQQATVAASAASADSADSGAAAAAMAESSGSAAPADSASADSHDGADMGRLREAIATFAQNVRQNTEYVGDKFAEEARAMHYGEKPHKGIRGRADKETAQELREEGISFESLPFPVDFPKAH